jgi:hypothetical protein
MLIGTSLLSSTIGDKKLATAGQTAVDDLGRDRPGTSIKAIGADHPIVLTSQNVWLNAINL